MLVTLHGIARAAALARRVGTDRSGLALIEFAYALPLLLTIALAGTEVANLAITVLRVNQLAMLAADNAARVRSSIDDTDINEIMTGMRFAGSGIKFGNYGRVIISSLQANGQTGNKFGYKIDWQRCFGAKSTTSNYGVAGTGATTAAIPYGVKPGGLATTAETGTIPTPNGALITAEITYTYHPLIAPAFMAQRDLHATQTFPVRDRAQQTLTNNTAIATANQRLCDNNHLSAT
jgi:hypothetical protein